jgi:hypothetical protein
MSVPDARPFEQPEAPLFSDGIGDRVVSTDPTTGELVQVLRINPSLTAVPSFEFALRERVARLANFRHPYYARVRRVDRAPSHPTALAVVSDHIEGTRLSDILRVAEERRLHLDINAALCLIRQLVPALALLHENARDAAHGLVSPERLIVTPHGQLIVAEHVCGAAVEQMQYGRERLWHELRIAMPPSAGIPRFDQRADVTGIGVVALSLVLGRSLRDDEFPRGINDLLNSARERTAMGDETPLSHGLRAWLACALQTDIRRAFASAPEALAALDQLISENPAYVPAPVALETFLSRYIAAVLVPAPPVRQEPATPRVAPAAPPIAVTAAPVAPLSPPAAAIPAPMVPPPAPPAEDLFVTPAAAPVEFAVEPAAPVEFAAEPAAPTPLFNAEEPFSIPRAAAPPPAVTKRGGGGGRKWLAIAAAVVILATGGFAGLHFFAKADAPAMATLSVESNPQGVPVFVDGVERGVTPAKITLAPGPHILELRRGVPRVIPVTLAAGAEVSQYLEFAESSLTAEMLAIPSAATPPPAPLAPPTPEASSAPLAGWISARLPFSVEIRENGRLIGTSETERIMLAAGSHQLEFVNETLNYRVQKSVQVTAGKVAAIPLELPNGTVNVNAVPWAEVWLNGTRIGETPIGNLAVPIGSHELVFRHPQLGEKRHAVSVAAGAPVRVSVDMKSK